MESPLTKDVVEAYKVVTGKDPRVYAIHAGLECGLFMEKYKDLDCTSIGPTLEHPHSPQDCSSFLQGCSLCPREAGCLSCVT